MVLNRHGQGLPHRNLVIATALSLPFPFELSTDPLLTPPVLATVNNQPLLIITSLSFLFIKEGSYQQVGPTTRLLPLAIIMHSSSNHKSNNTKQG
jgi:hypothetical protein